MAKKISYNEIRSINENWSLDNRNGYPYSGRSVLEFIKKTLNEKGGEFYYDSDTTKYLIFANVENRDLYLSDREEHADLLIGTFDAPANYTAEINMVTPSSNVILAGTTGNYIDFTFDVKSRSGSSTGEAVIVTYTFNNSGNILKVTQVYTAGTSVHFLVDQYLAAGTNSVSVVVTGRNTLASSMAAVNFTVVALELTSDFDFSQPIAVGEYLSIPYTLSGAGVKYLEWYIDGVLQQEVDTITDLRANRTKNIDTTGMLLGKHSVQTRAYFNNNGTNYYGATLYFDFVVCPVTTWESNVSYILLALVLPTPAVNTISVNATQYEELAYKIAVYDSRSRSLALTISDNGTLIQSITMQPDEIQSLSYTPTTTGNHILTFTCDGQTATITASVESSDIGIDEVTTDLLLKLSAKGRSNTEVDPAQWNYGSISTTFNNFAWNEQSGWNNGALVIPAGTSIDINFAPLGGNPITNGRTIEIDYETANIDNDDASVISLVNSGTNAGLDITASSAKLQSSGGANVNTKYKDGDRVHLAFIINKTTGDNGRLMFIVNNGILERAASFAATDVFQVNDNLHIGSNGCMVKIHSIRIYDKALTVDEAFCNYAVDSDNLIEIANNNDILNESTGLIDADKVNAKIPIMIITGDMQPIFDATDKNTTVYVDMEYRNLQDQSKNFMATHVRMRPQGTSSLGYPRKNLRPYTAAKYGCTMYDANGNVIEDGLYAFKDGSQPVNCWTLKADYAESSGSHNTGVARIWNDLMYNCQYNGEFPLRTEAQKTAIQLGYNYDVRTTVDGFPIVVFHRQTLNSQLVCLGQYNFNNDKSTEKVFGFTDIPGFDNTNVQCFEFLANENPICLFDDVSNFDTKWDEAFESRYPDTSTPNLVPLKTLATWINACKNNQSKWEEEKANHFDLPKLAAYYVYLMRFGAVDQTVKNAMITTEDGVHWFFINYDNDTILGIDNISTVLNAWNYDRTTQKIGGAYYYAGHNSVLWNCFEADDECIALAREIDNALYSAGLTYNNMVQMFDHEQCDKWCERIYNDNGAYKYIQPFKEKGSAVLYMLQGSRKSYRRWWLQHRFDLYDAMWATGAFRSRIVRFIAEGAQGGTFTITSAADTFFGYGINSVIQEAGVAVAKNGTHDFTIEQTLAIGDPVAIYNANNISKIDLSDFAAKLTTLYINQAIGNGGESELKSLILADGTTQNVVFTEIGGLNAINGLEEIDIRNFKAVTNVELTALPNLHIFKAADSGLTSFVPATGVTLTNVSLPATIQSIVLNGANVAALTYMPTTTLRSVSLRNVTGAWDAKTFVNTWLALLSDAQLANAELTLTGINWTGMTTEQVLKLGAVGTKNLQGKVTLSSITKEQYEQILEVFGSSVFDPNSSFIIDAPSTVLISGPTQIKSGNSGTYTSVVFPVGESELQYLMYNGSTLVEAQTDGSGNVYRSYGSVTLYEVSGVASVSSEITSDVSVNIKARVKNTTTYSDIIQLTAKAITYPSSVTINGADTLVALGTTGYDYTKSFNTDDFTAEVLGVVWSLSSETYTTISSQSASGTTLNYAVLPQQSTNVTLTCTVSFEGGRTLVGTKTISQALVPITSFGLAGQNGILTTGTYNYTIANFVPSEYNIGISTISASLAQTELDVSVQTSGMSVVLEVNEIPQPGESITIITEAVLSNGTILSNNKKITIGIVPKIECVYKGNGSTAVPIRFTNGLLPELISISIDGEDVSSSTKSYVFGDQNEHDVVFVFSTITSIGMYAFRDCSDLTSITIPNSVTSIGDAAFYNCRGLTSIIIPTNVTSIGGSAFYNCSGLTSITIPDNVTKINSYAFQSCSGLTSITIPASVTSIGESTFNQCTGLKTAGPIGGGYNIEFGWTTSIPENAFYNCSKLTSFTFPNGVTSIGKSAFSQCSGFTSLTIPNSVTSIGNYAFSGCWNMTSITIPDSVTSIGANVFQYCTNLKTAGPIGGGYDIEFGWTTSIPKSAFYGCSSLTSITFPNGVTSIGNQAFYGCSGLTSITIPNSVTSIGSEVFSNCTGLTSIIIGNGVTSISQYAFGGCTGLTSITIPSNVTSIDNRAFYGCTGLTAITIPNSVTSIGDSAFSGCTGLTSVTLPNNITSIAYALFYNCRNLTSITIPSSVTRLNATVFSGCSKIEAITCLCTSAPSAPSDIFGNNSSNYTGKDVTGTKTLYVPAGATSYDSGVWADPLQASNKCNFTLSATL